MADTYVLFHRAPATANDRSPTVGHCDWLTVDDSIHLCDDVATAVKLTVSCRPRVNSHDDIISNSATRVPAAYLH